MPTSAGGLVGLVDLWASAAGRAGQGLAARARSPGWGWDWDAPHDFEQDYQLFRPEDIWAWVVFTVVFFVLIIFDNFVLHTKAKKLTFKQSMAFTALWIACAAAFNSYIYFTRGFDDALDWGTGYLLEWMLSVDNLFVFHLIFQKFGTPDKFKHKPLFWGILGAIVFRMMFFMIEEVLMHKWWWVHILLGLFLVYTGLMTMANEDEDEDVTDNIVLRFMARHFRFVGGYDQDGNFFVRATVDANGVVTYPALSMAEADTSRSIGLVEEARMASSQEQGYGTSGPAERPGQYEYRATLLLLVVTCLELTDVVFAVDSVSAIVAQIPDLYLAYTACVFAMLGLRAMFFVIDELVKLFTLLKYGVAAILIFIGVKLLLKGWIHFDHFLVFVILVGTMVLSIIGSVIVDWRSRRSVGQEECVKVRQPVVAG